MVLFVRNMITNSPSSHEWTPDQNYTLSERLAFERSASTSAYLTEEGNISRCFDCTTHYEILIRFPWWHWAAQFIPQTGACVHMHSVTVMLPATELQGATGMVLNSAIDKLLHIYYLDIQAETGQQLQRSEEVDSHFYSLRFSKIIPEDDWLRCGTM